MSNKVSLQLDYQKWQEWIDNKKIIDKTLIEKKLDVNRQEVNRHKNEKNFIEFVKFFLWDDQNFQWHNNK